METTHIVKTHIHHHHLFSVGSEVEVSIDEEGFKGAWFRATVLRLPNNHSPSHKKKVSIQYNTLVREEDGTPLKESVDISSLRLVPPDIADRDFSEGDIVDANDKDGWWIGVVRKIVEKDIFSVFFESPPHSIDCERNQLRFHQDFVDDKWVRRQKMDVSILTDQLGNSFQDVNIPEENVQPESFKTVETNTEKEIPCSIISRNDLMEQPSIHNENTATFASTSKKRKRKLSSLNNTRISHPLKKLGEGNLPELATIAADELRKSKMPSRKTLSGVATYNSVGKGKCYSRKSCDNGIGSESTDKVGGEKASTLDFTGELDRQETGPANDGRGNILGQSSWTRVTDKEGNDDCEIIEMSPKGVSKMKESEMNNQLTPKATRMLAKNSLDLVANVVAPLLMVPGDVETNSNGQSREKSPDSEQQQASGNSQRRKRGRPRKLLIVPKATEGDKEQDDNGDHTGHGVIEGYTSGSHVVRRRNSNEPMQSKSKEVENSRVSSNVVDDDDRPLLTWFGGMQSLASINASRRTAGKTAKQKGKGSRQVIVANEAGMTDGTSDHTPITNQGWPFVKNSPIWKAIESLEVFRLIPQTPHFDPLGAFKEERREGLAIGNMVTFSSLVEKISKLQFDDQKHIFESILSSLSDLEVHGFDISLPSNRVKELLSIKDRKEQDEDRIREVENKILECTRAKAIFVEEIEAIEQKIAELQKKQASIKKEKEVKDHEITWLQAQVEAFRECGLICRIDFEKAVILPLKKD